MSCETQLEVARVEVVRTGNIEMNSVGVTNLRKRWNNLLFASPIGPANALFYTRIETSRETHINERW